jgi:1,4-dihydroxy-2-naphthoyl-CoA hydrolase
MEVEPTKKSTGHLPVGSPLVTDDQPTANTPVPNPLAALSSPNVHELLGVEIVEMTTDRVVMTLPVTPRVHQPFGLLHGGVSALLAESAASLGGALSVPEGKGVVGIELNASHLRSVRSGTLTATALPVRRGRTIQVWRITLVDQDDRPICEARCTLAVIDAVPPA